MKKLVHFICWIDQLAYKLSLIVSGLALISMVLIAALGVIFRFVLQSSLSWNEELDSYLFVWLTCLGAATGVRLRAHPQVRVAVDHLPDALRNKITVLADIAVAIFGGILIYYGADMVALTGSETASSLPISMVYPNLAIPVAGCVMVLHCAALLLGRLLPAAECRKQTPAESYVPEHV